MLLLFGFLLGDDAGLGDGAEEGAGVGVCRNSGACAGIVVAMLVDDVVDFSCSFILGVRAATKGVCGRRLRVLLLRLRWAPPPVSMVRVGKPLCTRPVSRCLGVL